MALMNVTVNKGEKCVFFSQSEFTRILPRVDTFLYGLYMYVHLQRLWFWCEKGIDFEHFGLHQHWNICSPSQMFTQMEANFGSLPSYIRAVHQF